MPFRFKRGREPSQKFTPNPSCVGIPMLSCSELSGSFVVFISLSAFLCRRVVYIFDEATNCNHVSRTCSVYMYCMWQSLFFLFFIFPQQPRDTHLLRKAKESLHIPQLVSPSLHVRVACNITRCLRYTVLER